MKHGKMILGELHADIPVIQGGMGVGISLSGLAGAVAAAGGIGIISTAQIGFREPDFDRDPIACNLRTIGKEIEKARQIAKGGIVGVNIMVATQHYEDYVRAAVQAGTDCIISGAGLPLDLPGVVAETENGMPGRSHRTMLAPIVSSPRACDVSTLYTRRSYEEYRRIAEYIAKTVWQKKGNYMVFFPSYKMLEEVYRIFDEEFSVNWVRCICQNSSMKESEREEFLEEFEHNQDSLVAFCIMGGIFSEGIDLMGEKLIGAIMVGTGLPQLGNEREILRSFYSEKGENGFDYAYRYPGMNKVLQAAGRVIRTREDKGVILLLDERFRQREYSSLFPVEWNDRKTCTLSNVEEQLKRFWEMAK